MNSLIALTALAPLLSPVQRPIQGRPLGTPLGNSVIPPQLAASAKLSRAASLLKLPRQPLGILTSFTLTVRDAVRDDMTYLLFYKCDSVAPVRPNPTGLALFSPVSAAPYHVYTEFNVMATGKPILMTFYILSAKAQTVTCDLGFGRGKLSAQVPQGIQAVPFAFIPTTTGRVQAGLNGDSAVIQFFKVDVDVLNPG